MGSVNFKFLLLIILFSNVSAYADFKIPSYKSDKVFIIVSDSGTYSSLLRKYSNGISEDFLVQKKNSFYLTPHYNFIDYSPLIIILLIIHSMAKEFLC